MHEPQSTKHEVLGWFSYLIFATAAIAGIPRLPELSDKFLFATAATFVVLVQGGGTIYMLFFEREILPKTVADEAAELFRLNQTSDDQSTKSESDRKCA